MIALATQRAIATAAFVGAVLPAWAAATSGAADACRAQLPQGTPLPTAAADVVAERVRGSALFTFPQLTVVEWDTRDKKAGESRSFLAFREGSAAPDVFGEIARRRCVPQRAGLEPARRTAARPPRHAAWPSLNTCMPSCCASRR